MRKKAEKDRKRQKTKLLGWPKPSRQWGGVSYGNLFNIGLSLETLL
jgi:hypothetical protein